MFQGAAEAEGAGGGAVGGGRKPRDNSLKAVSVVGRQASENIRAALGDKNRYTVLSCPRSCRRFDMF